VGIGTLSFLTAVAYILWKNTVLNFDFMLGRLYAEVMPPAEPFTAFSILAFFLTILTWFDADGGGLLAVELVPPKALLRKNNPLWVLWSACGAVIAYIIKSISWIPWGWIRLLYTLKVPICIISGVYSCCHAAGSGRCRPCSNRGKGIILIFSALPRSGDV
jgi:hypothetical protein